MTSDLLPRNEKEFRDKNYWEKFFKLRGNDAFEWYGEYENMSDLLDKYIKLNDSILVIGCGNSTLSEKMFDNGLKNIINIDISNIVIQQMASKNKDRKEMKFLKMNMLNMEFSNENFEVIIDKGTLDALMSGDQKETEVKSECEKMFDEIDRVLKFNGRYICISLAQSHIAKKVLETFLNKGWIIRIHKLNEYDIDFFLPVFVFVFTKMKIALKSPIIEFKSENESEKNKFERLNDLEFSLSRIKEYQQFGLAKFYISNKEIDLNDDFFVHLYELNSKEPRYTIYIIDNQNSLKETFNGKFAAFVVPLGKEYEWLFGTKSGRMELAAQAKYQRLLVVHLNRAHKYENMDQVINELSSKVMELAPKSISKSYKVPILSEGSDLDITELKFNGNSKFSGEFYIEDVRSNEDSIPTRRLIFQKINPIIQTEIILKKDETKKNKGKIKNLKPNYEFFLEDYFATLITHLYAINKRKDSPLKILIIGLGGGSLTMYCKQWIENCEIDAVEIDEEIARAAKDWFGLVEDQKTRVFVDDGLRFIDNASKSGKKWDIVIIDVNNDNVENDLWCPTKDFVEIDFLKNSKSILNDQGIFIVNVICRNENLKNQIYEKFKSLWSNMFVNKLKKSRNEIVFCTNNEHLLQNYDFSKDEHFNRIAKEANKVLFIEMSNNLIKLK